MGKNYYQLMKKKIPVLLFLSSMLVITCMCPNFGTDYFAKNKPTINDISGKYVPKKSTLDFIRNTGHYDLIDEISITLLQNGTFELKNMPDWWLTDFGKPEGCFDSGKGDWAIVKHQDWWQLKLRFISGENLCLDKYAAGLNASVPIVGDKFPYQLWFYVGDPDSNEIMMFEIVSE